MTWTAQTIKAISQTVAVAQEDKTSFIATIIQALGLNETKDEFLKSIITSYVNYSKPYGAGNDVGALPASDSSRQLIRNIIIIMSGSITCSLIFL